MSTNEVNNSSENSCLSNDNSNQENTYSSFNPENEEQEDLENLKGDAIGSTLYSERFVLKTLLKLSQGLEKELAENEPFENDLCALWDMTMEEVRNAV